MIVCKPWPVRHPAGHFSKQDFQIDLETLQATCPAGQVIPITPGKTVCFPADGCRVCALRSQCTSRESGGRTLAIHPQEDLLQRLSVLPTTAEGRAALRERVAVEHSLAHVSQRQGNRARYNGTRKNTCHLRLVCAIQNLERAQALSDTKMLSMNDKLTFWFANQEVAKTMKHLAPDVKIHNLSIIKNLGARLTGYALN